MCRIHLSLFTNLMQVGLGTLEVRLPKIWNRRALIFWGIWFFGVCAVLCLVAQLCQTLWDSMDYSLPGAFVLGDSPCPPAGDLPNLGIELRSLALQADSLPSEPLGKPNNTAVGSLSLLQRIFLTQESNWGLLNCRLILYQLSYREAKNLLDSG